MKLRSALANSAWLTLSIPDWQQFHHALRHPFQAQRRVLDEIEQTCRGTPVFPGPIDDNPVREWEAIEPFIARVASGETGVLTRERINHFEPTSGSSSASKLIPSTPLSRRQFNRAIHAWVVDTYRRNPGLLGGPAYWSISPASSHPPTAAGIRVGYEDDSEYLGVLSQWLVRQSLAVPSPVRRLPVDEFRRATLLFLLAQSELRLISVWNPTFLSALMGYLDEHRDSLLRELAAGIDVCGYRLQREITGDPWPKLGLISCWADGHAKLQLAGLKKWFPGVRVQPKGLLATEAIVSLPFEGRKVLAVTSHFLEFETDGGDLLRVGDLKEGDEVAVVVTTGSGLIRYRLGDRVAVTGFLERTPCIDFLGRGDMVSDLCGEKLNEAFVGRIVRRMVGEGFSLLVPEEAGYTLYCTMRVDERELERRLAENPQYEWAVQVGQLRPVRVVRVSEAAASTYLEVRRARGQKLGDIKPAALDCWGGWHDAFAPLRVED